MERVGAVIFFVVLFSCTAEAQFLRDRSSPPGELKPLLLTGSVSIKTEGPLLLLGSQETDYSSLLVDPREITVLKTFQDSAVLAPLGYKARNGVIAIELKNKKPLLNLTDVLDYFQVPEPHRQLRVLVNKQPVNPERFLADIKRIEKVEVIGQDTENPFRLGWDANEQFLNIVTVPPAQ